MDLKIKLSYVLSFKKKGEHIGWSSSGGGISKVAMDCKKWAWDIKHKTIRSGLAEFGGWANFADDNTLSFVSIGIPLTEQEAIFMACEWLLYDEFKND